MKILNSQSKSASVELAGGVTLDSKEGRDELKSSAQKLVRILNSSGEILER